MGYRSEVPLNLFNVSVISLECLSTFQMTSLQIPALPSSSYFRTLIQNVNNDEEYSNENNNVKKLEAINHIRNWIDI